MPSPLPTLIIRHKKENLKKCSLTGLEKRADCLFFTYPLKNIYDFSSCFCLTLEEKYPLLSPQDAEQQLILVDGTWKLAEKMSRVLQLDHLPKRSLPPHFRTAYPRRQEDCQDPHRGLASVEALFIAHTLLGKETAGILDHYYWKEEFLQMNDFHLLEVVQHT